VIQWILFVLPSSFERADARVPLVVATQTVACTCNSESGIPTNELGLREYDLHRMAGLRPLHVSEKRPQDVER
jgi:hypothetical protein